MIRRNLLVAAVLVFAFVVTSCANRKNLSPVPTVKQEVKDELASPVNCRTAGQDIRVLEEEKASVGKRMLSGARSIMPISAAAGILMGDYRDRVEVATGQYNADLENKIMQIKRTCRIR